MKSKSLICVCLSVLVQQPRAYAQAQWGLEATNWKKSESGRPVLVAVIDTGIDIHHPGLKDRIWVNPGEAGKDSKGKSKSDNGIDDDGNGYVDDVHGWNFVERNNDVQDKHGHGTHIAGIIAAHGKVQGVSSNVRIMALRYFDSQNNVDLVSTTIKAMEYAIQNGARIINYSAGGFLPNRLEERVVKLALKHKVLIVAAAGNESTDTDLNGFFPASYQWPHILSVASIDSSKHLAKKSNYGPQSVKIAAPGEFILSLLPNGKYGLMSGTSQATAFVTGAAAEILAHGPKDQEPILIVDRLISSGTSLTQLRGRTVEATLLNIRRSQISKSSGLSVAGQKLNQ